MIRECADVKDSHEQAPGPAKPVKDWSNRPVLIALHPKLPNQRRTDGGDPQDLPLNDSGGIVEFESDVLFGKALFRVRDMENAPTDYFEGRNRKFSTTIQCRFKEKLRFDDVMAGQEFERPFTNVPAKWLVRAVMALIRRLQPALRDDIFADEPFFYSPLAAVIQKLTVSHVGDEPDMYKEVEERTALLGGVFEQKQLSFTKRKKYFAEVKHLQHFWWRTDLVYTMEFYQHMFHPKTFNFESSVVNIRAWPILNGQPPQTMAKVMSSGKYLYSFQLWNEKLLADKDSEHDDNA